MYPVNPKYRELEGLPCYPSVAAIPYPVEMVILLVPARFTLQILEECAAKGVRGVMIQSAGFAETGEQGRELQAKCVAIARQAGMRLWGPNCMGLVDVPGQKYFTFMSPNITRVLPPHGTLSLVVQSGMLSAGFLADLATRRGIAVNKACSIGNKCDVDECDVLEYLLSDDSTKGVALYLESMPRGRRFMELAEGATKPLVVLKSGRSASGAKAALSHTASLAGDARLTQGPVAGDGRGTARDFTNWWTWDGPYPVAGHLGRGQGGGAHLQRRGGHPLLRSFGRQRPAPGRPGPRDSGGVGQGVSRLDAAGQSRGPVPAMELHGPGPTLDHAVQAVSQDPNVDLVLMHTFLGGTQDQVNLARYKELLFDQGKGMVFWALGLDQPVKEFEAQAQPRGSRCLANWPAPWIVWPRPPAHGPAPRRPLAPRPRDAPYPRTFPQPREYGTNTRPSVCCGPGLAHRRRITGRGPGPGPSGGGKAGLAGGA